ncbi:MAG TPA: nucleotidyltransferase family protein [Candidatus Hydrogenedens sp.]|nr:nucleotidyltransferase family protein [Candidatus Hydrogenedens sp.]HOK09239.1 nucleotidyltransferase family protein [Candidatus Hydrogenedens sp.]HOL21188.1 nucleotidyltransferase family protein [Candidatus Hydrogenedens sp.]HPP60088.1 nucleotidyltransferase family protein [Candidatus Hydrogenedens sp.]
MNSRVNKTINLEYIKKILEEHKSELKKKYNIKEIGIFGSYARNEINTESDIDILIDFKDDGKTFDNYIELKLYLEALLQNKVDLVMKGALKKSLKKRILQEVIYV